MPEPVDQLEFEAMARRYLAKIGRRYAPVAIGGVLLVLVLLLVPTTQPPRSTGFAGGVGPSGAQDGAGGLTATAPGGTPAASAPTGASGAVAVGGAVPGNGAGGAAGVSNPSASGAGAPVDFPAAAGSASGVARTGAVCKPGARQFSWSGHSPACEAAFSGNNGGARAQGVTGSTITLTFRVPSSTDDQAIAAATGSANVNYPAMISDYNTYIGYFNTQFELYGRHVVLKAYNGQGDYIQEDQGQNLGAAQADAVTAHDMGAFGDVTFSLGSSQPYEQDLAEEHVMSFSSIGQPQSFFQQYAPYEWSVQGPSGTVGVQEAAAIVCRRLSGMPAIFSGDALARQSTRVFGMIYPEVPNYAILANQYKQLLQQECGQSVKQTSSYAIDVAQFPNEAAAIIAQMNAAHVTTILCACDPVFPVFLTRSASGQQYHPEWVATTFGDPSGRLYDQSEWQHALGGGTQFPASTETEAYRVFQLASPGHQPAEGGSASPPYFYVPYYTLLHIFGALQAAGPDLTAASFQRAMFSLPPSIGPDPIGGQWKFGPNVYDPVNSFGLVWWDPNAKDPFDNNTGRYAWCNGGQQYSVDNLAALGGPKQQLGCFGH